MTIESKVTTFADAFDRLSTGLSTSQSIQVGSFKDFLINIWALSFEHPEYFNAWHVGQIAEDIEYCLEEGLNYCAVLPRFHFKSTVLGHAFSVWSLLKAKRDAAVLYLSYSDGMARYHISEINKSIARNPILTEWMDNRSPKADFSARYYVNKKPMDIRHGGLFSFKRGMHVNGALIADDVLRDPENPLNIGQVTTDTYAVALQKCRRQAAILLKEEDEMLRVDQQLETEIRSHRRIVKSTDSIGNDLSCPNCNKFLSDTTDPCPDCGVHSDPDSSRG